MIDVQAPPPLWAVPYTGPGIELRLPLNRVGIVCRLLGLDADGTIEIDGCSLWTYGGCLIIIPKAEGAVSEADQSKVRVHEEAHCNGWHHEQ